MTPTSTDLLKALGSGARPGSASLAPAAPGTLENSGFADLLDSARAGTMSSRRPVTIQSGANVTLSNEELDQLAAAADKAEASGIRKALVMVGDKQLIMDVQTRSIVGPADLSKGCLTGIDGAIKIGAGGGAAGAQILPTPRVDPATLMNLSSLSGTKAA